MTETSRASQYALGNTDAEHERLMRQAARLAPSTGRFFRDVIRDARFHGRGDADRAMNAAEVVVREIQRKRRPVVLKLLRESVGQASESPNLHAHMVRF